MMAERAGLPDDDAALVEAVQSANLPTLLMVLVHLTGDVNLLRGEIRPQRATPQRPDGGLGGEQAAQVRARALEVLRAFRDGGGALPPLPGDELLSEMMSFSLGQPVAPEYVPMMRRDMFAVANAPGLGDAPRRSGTAPRDFQVLVIGAGMSGILAALRLSQAGIRYLLVEKNSDVGGTWLENSYPGCRVDLPNHFYSYSFEPNHDWSDHFSRRDELLAYFRRVADKYGVRAHARFQTEVSAARYDPARARWAVTLRERSGREQVVHVSALISAVGQLNRPSVPALPGLENFAGPAFHTARWRHDVDLAGKRVAVVGTGASAMQVVPQLAREVSKLLIFQRSAQWAARNPDYFRPVSEGKKWLLRHVPFYAAWYRFRLFFLNADGVHEALQIDPSWPHPRRAINARNDRIRHTLTEYINAELGERTDLRAAAVPDYPPFAKRMLLDNDWFRTLTRDNVELVTERIAAVSERGLRTESGAHHDLDAIVFATGFQANRFLWPMTITGRRGSLHELWGDDPRAHLGITVPGFPNLFCLYGPNTNLAHGGSIIFHSECQMHYILGCLNLLAARGHDAMECKQSAHDAYNARVDAAHERMVWSHPHVTNWYRNSAGRVTTNSPFRLVDYWAMTRAPDPADFEFSAAQAPREAGPPTRG
jgi:4-hydroxyacetophenone monooxygenase